jgi:molecular chaperone GrpE (heat shock protein)
MAQRFRYWLARLIQGSTEPAPANDSGVGDGRASQELEQERALRLAAGSELQQLRLDLKQGQQRAAQLQADLSRQAREQGDTLTEQLQIQLEELLTPLATPLTQLLTQQHLIEVQGKELSAKDLLATSRRIWLGLTTAGVDALEAIGEVVAFNPDRHQPLSQATSLRKGESVKVRIPGITLKGKVLKAAAVEPIQQEEGESVVREVLQ